MPVDFTKLDLSTDAAFWRAFQARTIPGPNFGHEAHLRAAYLLLERTNGDVEAALPLMRDALKDLLDFARRQGHEPKVGYHETITILWLRLVAHHMAAREFESSTDFVRAAPALADKKAVMLRHYTRERLMSPEARARWIEPDLAPLPEDPATRPRRTH